MRESEPCEGCDDDPTGTPTMVVGFAAFQAQGARLARLERRVNAAQAFDGIAEGAVLAVAVWAALASRHGKELDPQELAGALIGAGIAVILCAISAARKVRRLA